jgi:hypothetical protein
MANGFVVDGFVIGNFIANAGLVAIVGWFIKKWINKTEATVESTASALAAVTLQHGKDLAEVTEKNRKEVKEAESELLTIAKENRKSINDLVIQVKVANGRTSSLETEIVRVEGVILTQTALCKQRNEGRRTSDRCD